MKNKFQIFINILFVWFFFILMKNFDYSLFFEYLQHISLSMIMLIFVFFTLTYFLKSVRIWYLNPWLGIRKATYVTFTHNFFLTLIPFKLWELVYIKKMKEQDIETSKWFSDILIIRLYDSLVLWILIVISFMLLGFDFSYFTILFLGVVFLVFYLFFFNIKIVLKIMNIINGKIKYKIIWKIIKFLYEWFLNISKLSDKNKIILLIISVWIWICSFLPWVIILNLILDITLWQWVLVVLISLIFNFLPINSIGWLGTIHAGWIAWLLMVKVSYVQWINVSMFLYSVFIAQLVLNYLLVQTIKVK